MKIALAATNNWLLKPFALLLALIFNGLFAVISGMTASQALAITIILFTFLVRLLMMPLMLKQQRSTRRMTRLQPKVKRIQDKYTNKKDPESNQRMQMEINQLYKDNKANPMSGCLPLLIQMPIIFALFEVLRNVPSYVNSIGDLYQNMTTFVMSKSNYATVLMDNFEAVAKGIQKFDINAAASVQDLLYHLSRTQWTDLIKLFNIPEGSQFMADLAKVQQYNGFGAAAGAFSFNLSENPGWLGWGVIFPIISGLTTFLQSWLAQRSNEKRQKMASPDGIADPSQNSMKMMTYIFPVMTLFFTASMPLGLGLYWIASNVFGIISQVVSDRIIDNEEIKEALKKRDEFMAKKEEMEKSRSKVDRATGGRLGSASYAQSKASLSGNRQQKVQVRNGVIEGTATVVEEEIVQSSAEEGENSEV